jgi:hypothetical protein
MMNRVLKIMVDRDPIDPTENGDLLWRFINFNPNTVHHVYLDEFLEGDDDAEPDELKFTEGLTAKLANGLAHFLIERQDGFHISSDLSPREAFDARRGGLLVWEHIPSEMGATDIEGRTKDAKAFLTEYNAWRNGDVYGFTLADEHKQDLEDSCWGFYDFASMLEHFGNLRDGDELIVQDETQCTFETKLFQEKFPGVTIVSQFSASWPTDDDVLLNDILAKMKSSRRTMELCDMADFIPRLEKRLEGIKFRDIQPKG